MEERAVRIDADRIEEWLNQQWQGVKQCPICNNNRWGIGEKPVEVREFHGGGLLVSGPVYPLIAITCGVCGYTLLFNAIVTGLLEPQQDPSISPPKPPKTEEP